MKHTFYDKLNDYLCVKYIRKKGTLCTQMHKTTQINTKKNNFN